MASDPEEPQCKKAKLPGSFADVKPLAGRVALVTGSSEGVGSGIALELAKAGASVCVNYIGDNVADAEGVATQVREQGSRAIIVKADVSDRPAVEEMFSTIEKDLGVIDILVTNAITSKRQSILETNLEDFKKTMDVGVFGVFNCMQCAARQMVAAGKK